jgi:hypothetical protein
MAYTHKAIKAARRRRLLLDAASGDENFSSVQLLLAMDGEDAATATTDASANEFVPTFSGNAQLDTAQAKFGASSLLLDGTDDVISIADDANLELGSGDFTLECHVRYNGDPGDSGASTFISKWHNAGAREYVWGKRTSVNTVEFVHSVNGTNGIVSGSWTWDPADATWYHLAVTRDGANLRFFVDGTQQGAAQTTISTDTIADTTAPTYIGGFINDGVTVIEELNGWVDNVRITKGVARYTGNFAPPTAAYPTSA